jgi:hypothetical protein
VVRALAPQEVRDYMMMLIQLLVLKI